VISRHELPKLSANRVLQVGGKELAERKIDRESEAAGNRELKAPCIPRTPAKAPDARVAWSDACHADDPRPPVPYHAKNGPLRLRLSDWTGYARTQFFIRRMQNLRFLIYQKLKHRRQSSRTSWDYRPMPFGLLPIRSWALWW